jgi:hypothetical protein
MRRSNESSATAADLRGGGLWAWLFTDFLKGQFRHSILERMKRQFEISSRGFRHTLKTSIAGRAAMNEVVRPNRIEVHDRDALATARAVLDACADATAMGVAVTAAVARNAQWRGADCITLLAPEAPTSPGVRALLAAEIGTRAAEGHIGPVNRWFAGTPAISTKSRRSASSYSNSISAAPMRTIACARRWSAMPSSIPR